MTASICSGLAATARRLLGKCVALLALGGIPSLAQAQTLTLSDTAVTVANASSSPSLVSGEIHSTNGAKLNALLAFAQAEMQCPVAMVTNSGFTTTVNLKIVRGGVTVAHEARITVIPLALLSKRYPEASAAIVLVRYKDAPQLAYPRLLLRYRFGWTIEEFALRLDGHITKMTAKFGDCLLRSSLMIVQDKIPAASRALTTMLNQKAGTLVFASLQAIYDVRAFPCGQRELCLMTSLMSAANVEEEYVGGYISGVLDGNFKPGPRDSWLQKEVKKLMKDFLDQLRQEVKKALWSAIKGIFGL